MNHRQSEENPYPVSPPRMAEQIFVALCFAALLILPPIFIEPFPLSAIPMFAIPRHEIHIYNLTDSNGKELNRDQYGLRTNVNVYLEHFYGARFPESLVAPLDREPDMERVLSNIRVLGNRNGAAFPLRLTSKVYGAVDDQTVGLIRSRSWMVSAEGMD